MSDSTLTAAAALDAIDEGVLVQDSDTQVVYANRAAGELLGLDRDELRGRSELPTPCECLSESGEALPERWPGIDALRTGRPQRPVFLVHLAHAALLATVARAREYAGSRRLCQSLRL